MLIYLLGAIVVFQLVVIAWLLVKRGESSSSAEVFSNTTPQSVSKFYNETTDKFLAVYGEIIQAFRTNNVEDYLNYTARSMQLEAGMNVIDAGCGVCGPACYFSANLPGLRIEAVTISEVQAEKGKLKVAERNLLSSINITIGDYHKLEALFPEESADRVYFLESFGHSNDKEKAIHSAHAVLKPGGKLYIKDLFLRESEDEWEQHRINEIAGRINKAYHYQISDLHEVVTAIRKKGFLIEFIRSPQVERDQFEHLTISNDFQNLFDIGKIESWENYVFPIDFFEILAEKPSFNPLEKMHLHFLNR